MKKNSLNQQDLNILGRIESYQSQGAFTKILTGEEMRVLVRLIEENEHQPALVVLGKLEGDYYEVVNAIRTYGSIMLCAPYYWNVYATYLRSGGQPLFHVEATQLYKNLEIANDAFHGRNLSAPVGGSDNSFTIAEAKNVWLILQNLKVQDSLELRTKYLAKIAKLVPCPEVGSQSASPSILGHILNEEGRIEHPHGMENLLDLFNYVYESQKDLSDEQANLFLELLGLDQSLEEFSEFLLLKISIIISKEVKRIEVLRVNSKKRTLTVFFKEGQKKVINIDL